MKLRVNVLVFDSRNFLIPTNHVWYCHS